MMSVTYAECHLLSLYAEGRYAEYRYAERGGAGYGHCNLFCYNRNLQL